MEKSNVNANVNVDVTAEKIGSVGKNYREMISKVIKEGKLYRVVLADDITCFGQKERMARTNPEIGAIARWAKEEKEGKTLDAWFKEFKENGIAFDGKTVPEFIDTIEDVKKAEEKKAEAEKKAEEKKAKAEKKATKTEQKTVAK